MKYRFQVQVAVLEPGKPARQEWKDVRPKGGAPYEYATFEEAAQMARLCYGVDARVIEIPEAKDQSDAWRSIGEAAMEVLRKAKGGV
jgi:hypothetical protein